MRYKLNIKFLFIFGIISLVLLSSCTRKNYKYIEAKKGNPDTTTHFKNIPPVYHLLPQDILYVKILTTDEKINKMFTIGTQGNVNQSRNGSSFYLSGFAVSDSGYIELPIVGLVKVAGQTMKEAQKTIREKVNVMLPNAIVNVKLVSYKVTFLGEVGNEGPQFIFQDKINILEALARVGGITDVGDKANVLIVRPTDTGNKVIRVDVSDIKLLESEHLYLYSEDVIIVEPIKSKIFRLNVSDYSLIVSTFVSTLTTVFLVLNLVK